MLRHEDLATPMEHLRFRIEAEAVAALQHPNIVQLFEVGEVGNTPYLVLEYVDGPTLAERIGEKPLSLSDAVEVVRNLAQAVDYAHRRGVVHRDLKPGNVLITADDTPKVSDFGLAKRLADEPGVSLAGGGTASGAVFGTPAYMAPEQASGRTRDVGPPTDVYSLGAILYELTTGRTPFKAASVLELLEQVRSVEPVPPRRRCPKISRDLETVCLKCLEKDPARRYASAEALANELRRVQNGEPIQARPVAWWEVAVKWMRRKPAIASLTIGLAAVVFLSLVGLTILYIHAESQRKIASDERNDAIEARTRAEQSESLTKAINRFFLDDVVGASRPKGFGLGKDVKLREALDAAAPKIGKTLADKPAAEAGVSDALGRAYVALGLYDAALPLLQRAVTLREQVLGVDHVDTLSSRLALARRVFESGQVREAERMQRDCFEAARLVHGNIHPITLEAQVNLVTTLRLMRNLPEAKSLCENAVELSEAALGSDHSTTREAKFYLALMAIAQGDNVKAEALLRRLWEDHERLEGPDHAQTLVVEGRLAETLQLLGRFEEAEAVFRRTLDAQRRIMGAEHPGTYTIQGSLAMSLKSQGKFAEAASLFDDTIKGYQRTLSPGHVLIGFMQSLLGDTLTELGQFTEAEPLLRKGYESMQSSTARDPRRSREGAERLARLYRKWGKTDEAALWEAKEKELQSEVQRSREKKQGP